MHLLAFSSIHLDKMIEYRGLFIKRNWPQTTMTDWLSFKPWQSSCRCFLQWRGPWRLPACWWSPAPWSPSPWSARTPPRWPWPWSLPPTSPSTVQPGSPRSSVPSVWREAGCLWPSYSRPAWKYHFDQIGTKGHKLKAHDTSIGIRTLSL